MRIQLYRSGLNSHEGSCDAGRKTENQANPGSEVGLLIDGAEWASEDRKSGVSVWHTVGSGLRKEGIRGARG